jgi:hypothetical protein
MAARLDPEDIALIAEMINRSVDERIKRPATTSTRPAKNYHTVPEIRKIAMDLLPEFREWVMSDAFELAVIRHFLMVHIEARPGDSVLISNGGKGGSYCTRLESQVNNAIQSWGLDSPFEKGEERAQYRFR